jgi:uncharacterized membrane protein YphA (DoxX/SURF4 family)
MAWLTILTELLGGLAVLLGTVGYEVFLLYIACLATLVIGGSGPFAIDGRIRKRFESRTSTGRLGHAIVVHPAAP